MGRLEQDETYGQGRHDNSAGDGSAAYSTPEIGKWCLTPISTDTFFRARPYNTASSSHYPFTNPMQALLNTAIKAARRGGDMAARQLKRVHELKIESKGVNDFVTQVDRAVEEKIIESINATGYRVLGENNHE